MSKATVVAMGNTKTCSYCRTLDTMIAKADMAEELPGADFIFADQAKSTSLYANWKAKAKLSGSIPQIAKIEALCPDCCVGGDCDPDESADDGDDCGGCVCEACGCEVNFCPECGKEL